MRTAGNGKPGTGTVLLLVGTTKGAFLLRGDRGRRRLEVSGPHFPGDSVYALAYDGRAGRRRRHVAVRVPGPLRGFTR